MKIRYASKNKLELPIKKQDSKKKLGAYNISKICLSPIEASQLSSIGARSNKITSKFLNSKLHEKSNKLIEEILELPRVFNDSYRNKVKNQESLSPKGYNIINYSWVEFDSNPKNFNRYTTNQNRSIGRKLSGK